GGQSLALLGWWFAVAERVWLRHALIALAFVPLYSHYALLALADGPSPAAAPTAATRRWVLSLAWAQALACAALLSPRGTSVWVRPAWHAAPDPRTTALFEVTAKLREIAAADPSARFWGYGFWRNWDVQSLWDVRLENLADPHEI